MADKKSIQEKHDEHRMWRELRTENMSHWRAWGSWFSWGSPIGLGLFFVETAIAIAILVYVFRG